MSATGCADSAAVIGNVRHITASRVEIRDKGSSSSIGGWVTVSETNCNRRGQGQTPKARAPLQGHWADAEERRRLSASRRRGPPTSIRGFLVFDRRQPSAVLSAGAARKSSHQNRVADRTANPPAVAERSTVLGMAINRSFEEFGDVIGLRRNASPRPERRSGAGFEDGAGYWFFVTSGEVTRS